MVSTPNIEATEISETIKINVSTCLVVRVVDGEVYIQCRFTLLVPISLTKVDNILSYVS